MKDFNPDSSVVERVEPSPNFEERAGGRKPDMIVLHYTGCLLYTSPSPRDS